MSNWPKYNTHSLFFLLVCEEEDCNNVFAHNRTQEKPIVWQMFDVLSFPTTDFIRARPTPCDDKEINEGIFTMQKSLYMKCRGWKFFIFIYIYIIFSSSFSISRYAVHMMAIAYCFEEEKITHEEDKNSRRCCIDDDDTRQNKSLMVNGEECRARWRMRRCALTSSSNYSQCGRWKSGSLDANWEWPQGISIGNYTTKLFTLEQTLAIWREQWAQASTTTRCSAVPRLLFYFYFSSFKWLPLTAVNARLHNLFPLGNRARMGKCDSKTKADSIREIERKSRNLIERAASQRFAQNELQRFFPRFRIRKIGRPSHHPSHRTNLKLKKNMETWRDELICRALWHIISKRERAECSKRYQYVHNPCVECHFCVSIFHESSWKRNYAVKFNLRKFLQAMCDSILRNS